MNGWLDKFKNFWNDDDFLRRILSYLNSLENASFFNWRREKISPIQVTEPTPYPIAIPSILREVVGPMKLQSQQGRKEKLIDSILIALIRSMDRKPSHLPIGLSLREKEFTDILSSYTFQSEGDGRLNFNFIDNFEEISADFHDRLENSFIDEMGNSLAKQVINNFQFRNNTGFILFGNENNITNMDEKFRNEQITSAFETYFKDLFLYRKSQNTDIDKTLQIEIESKMRKLGSEYREQILKLTKILTVYGEEKIDFSQNEEELTLQDYRSIQNFQNLLFVDKFKIDHPTFEDLESLKVKKVLWLKNNLDLDIYMTEEENLNCQLNLALNKHLNFIDDQSEVLSKPLSLYQPHIMKFVEEVETTFQLPVSQFFEKSSDIEKFRISLKLYQHFTQFYHSAEVRSIKGNTITFENLNKLLVNAYYELPLNNDELSHMASQNGMTLYEMQTIYDGARQHLYISDLNELNNVTVQDILKLGIIMNRHYLTMQNDKNLQDLQNDIIKQALEAQDLQIANLRKNIAIDKTPILQPEYTYVSQYEVLVGENALSDMRMYEAESITPITPDIEAESITPNIEVITPDIEAITPITPITPDIEPITPITPITPDIEAITPITPITPDIEAESITPNIEAITPITPITPNIEAITPDIEAESIIPITPITPDIEPITPNIEVESIIPITPITPDIEAITPITPITPNIEATTPDIEPITPNIEAITPNIEATTPDIEPITPNIEAITPDIEAESIIPITPITPDIEVEEREEKAKVRRNLENKNNFSQTILFVILAMLLLIIITAILVIILRQMMRSRRALNTLNLKLKQKHISKNNHQ